MSFESLIKFFQVPKSLKTTTTTATKASKFEWVLDNIRIKKIISAPIWAGNTLYEVSALIDLRHCPKSRSCATSRKTSDVTLRI